MQLELSEKWKKELRFLIAVLLVYVGFRYGLPLFFPFVLAAFVSTLLYPFIRRMGDIFSFRTERGRTILVAICVFVFYGILFIGFGWLCFGIWGQGKSILLNVPFYQVKWDVFLRDCCGKFDDTFHVGQGTSYMYLMSFSNQRIMNVVEGMCTKLTGYSVQMAGRFFSLFVGGMITILATFFILQEYEYWWKKIGRQEWGSRVCKVLSTCKKTLCSYIKAQGLILLINGGICLVIFRMIGQPYYLLFACLVAFIDALPVLGAGFLLIPYALFHLLRHNVLYAVLLFASYVLCVMSRQYVESRMVGAGLGMKPLYTIASMYVGLRLFGIFGILLGPIGFLILRECRF